MQNIELESIDSEIITIKPTDIIGTILEFRNKELVTSDRLSEEFRELKRNIKEAGLLVPLTLAPHETNKGKYNIVDGRRRLAALVQLGHKEIRANVLKGKSELDLVLIAINLNDQRLNLTEEERIDSILKAFTKGGYEFPRDLELVKSEAHKIHNNKDASLKFKTVYDRLGKSAVQIWFVLRWITDTSPEVFTKMLEVDLDVELRKRLVKKELKDNLDVQLQALHAVIIAEHIGLSRGDDLAQIRADQYKLIEAYIDDIIKTQRQDKKSGSKTIWKSLEKDRYLKIQPVPKTFKELKIDPQEQPKTAELIGKLQEKSISPPKSKKEERPTPEVVRTARLKLTDMREAMNKFLIESTGTDEVLNNDPEKTLKHTEYYREEIVNSLIEQDAYPLIKNLLAVSEAAHSFVDLIFKRYPKETMMYGKK